jgi:hypothetical protein
MLDGLAHLNRMTPRVSALTPRTSFSIYLYIKLVILTILTFELVAGPPFVDTRRTRGGAPSLHILPWFPSLVLSTYPPPIT